MGLGLELRLVPPLIRLSLHTSRKTNVIKLE